MRKIKEKSGQLIGMQLQGNRRYKVKRLLIKLVDIYSQQGYALGKFLANYFFLVKIINYFNL